MPIDSAAGAPEGVRQQDPGEMSGSRQQRISHQQPFQYSDTEPQSNKNNTPDREPRPTSSSSQPWWVRPQEEQKQGSTLPSQQTNSRMHDWSGFSPFPSSSSGQSSKQEQPGNSTRSTDGPEEGSTGGATDSSSDRSEQHSPVHIQSTRPTELPPPRFYKEHNPSPAGEDHSSSDKN
jgi:hypothetical protein